MHYSVFLMFLFLDFSGLVFSKCIGEDWIPYKNEKCVKILDIVETHDAAVEICRNIDYNPDDSATLLTVNTEEEQHFLNNLLINNTNIFDNIWLGGRRINNTADFAWPDGTSITGEVYSNWAPGKPTSDLGTDCIELRSTLAFLQDSASWHNVRCGKRNLVVCQRFAYLSNGEIQAALLQTNQEIKRLKETLLNVQTSLSDLDKRIQLNANEIVQKGKDIQTLNQNVQSSISELQRKIQLNTNQINEKGREIDTVKANFRQLDQTAVKNIRLTNKEMVMVWRGPGYVDTSGYVITGVENWNKDDFPDHIYRRKMEKLVNGNWVSV